jgi:uncharacterized membrane protein YphA (DoxX/SURF4 family)
LTASLLVTVVRDVLGITLLAAGIPKLIGNEEFRDVLRDYSLLPNTAVRVVAWTIPCSELAVGLGLVFGTHPVIALAVTALGFVVFAIAIAVNLTRGRSVDCGCFGSSRRSEASWRHVGIDVGLALVAAAVAVWCGIDPAAGTTKPIDAVRGGLLSFLILVGLRLVITLMKVESTMRRIPDVA